MLVFQIQFILKDCRGQSNLHIQPVNAQISHEPMQSYLGLLDLHRGSYVSGHVLY